MTVLEQSPGTAPPVEKAARHEATCLNCGKPFPRGPRAAEFCGRPCVREWNNRRMTRGADLYDLIMVHRYDRDAATRNKVWRAINRLAAKYRDEDMRERSGRRSWRRLRAVIETRLFLWSK